MGACKGCYTPGVAPAVAVEQGKGPQVDGSGRESQHHAVGHGIQEGAAMVVDHALRIARGARRVVERYGIPFVGRQQRFVFRVSLEKERLIGHVAEARVVVRVGVVDGDDVNRLAVSGERLPDRVRELPVRDQHPGSGVAQHERDRCGIQAEVEGIEHGPGHGHAEMGFQDGRPVLCHDRDALAGFDPVAAKRARQAPASFVHSGVGYAPVAVDPCRSRRMRDRGADQKIDRGQRFMVSGIGVEACFEPAGPGVAFHQGSQSRLRRAFIAACPCPVNACDGRRRCRRCGGLPQVGSFGA